MGTLTTWLRYVPLLATACWQLTAVCQAQTYPAKNIRYLITGSPGSGTDTLGRLIADGLASVLGRQVIVENRSGGGSNIGADIAAKSPPDGYLLFQCTITHAINVTLYRNLTYNFLRDFAPVTETATGPAVLVVHPSLPAKSVGELIKLAKARPGAIDYGSGGTGTFTFLAGELFKGHAGVNLLHIPYRGGGAALTAIIAGEVQVYFAPVGVAFPNIREGRLRPLAVTTLKRVPMVPDIPTLSESGLPGYETGNWYGLLVPAKTPPEIVATIRSAVISVLNNPTVGKRINDFGFVTVGSTSAEFAAYMKQEAERLGKIVKAFNLTAD